MLSQVHTSTRGEGFRRAAAPQHGGDGVPAGRRPAHSCGAPRHVAEDRLAWGRRLDQRSVASRMWMPMQYDTAAEVFEGASSVSKRGIQLGQRPEGLELLEKCWPRAWAGTAIQ